MDEKKSFAEYLERRTAEDTASFFTNPAIQKSYYIGAYSYAVIASSYYSEVSHQNTTFKTWLSNQIINYSNLFRIFEMAERFERKLRLNIKNSSEVRKLVHSSPVTKTAGISSAKISYAFIAGFDDYKDFIKSTGGKTAEPDQTDDDIESSED
jgi:hypothetical protein